MDFIQEIEKSFDRKAVLNFMDMQPGDVIDTWANVDALTEQFNYRPGTKISTGVKKFSEWYKLYYNI